MAELNFRFADIFGAGVAATTASLLIAILIFNYVAAMFLPFTRELSRKTLRLQSFVLLFACTFLLASMIPFMLFFVNRQADVKAFIGSVQLPDTAVKAVEKASGSTRIYKDISYRAFPFCPPVCPLDVMADMSSSSQTRCDIPVALAFFRPYCRYRVIRRWGYSSTRRGNPRRRAVDCGNDGNQRKGRCVPPRAGNCIV